MRVDPSFFLIIVLLGLNPNDVQPVLILSWVAIAFASVLLHELGHAVAFRLFGVQPSVMLYGMGGLTSGEGRLKPLESITVSLAGPVSVLLLIGVPALWLQSQGTVTTLVGRTILSQVIWINVWWSILNLLPILPLDGGNVTRSMLDLATKGRGRRPAEVISVVVAVGLGLLALQHGLIFGVFLAGLFVVMNVSSLSKVKHDELGDELQFGQRALIEHRPADAQVVAERCWPTGRRARRCAGPPSCWAGRACGRAIDRGPRPPCSATPTPVGRAGRSAPPRPWPTAGSPRGWR